MQKWRFFEGDTESFREVWNGEENEQSEIFEGKTKNILKNDLYAQNTWFSQLSQVASKLLGPVDRTLKTKILKNLLECFLRLEVLPARESRGKLWKSLSPLATGPSTREQVARMSHEKH